MAAVYFTRAVISMRSNREGPLLTITTGDYLDAGAGNQHLTHEPWADIRLTERFRKGHGAAYDDSGKGRKILQHSVVDGPGGVV